MNAEEAAGASSSRTTVTVVDSEKEKAGEPKEEQSLQLRKKEKDKKRVGWSAETVDNEHLGRKKSKCCCVYQKPQKFKGPGDSSSGDDSDGDDCGRCPGHHGKDVKGG